MMRQALFGSKKLQEFPEVAIASVRTFIAVPKVTFSEDVSAIKPANKDAPSSVDSWSAKKAETESLLKLLHTYKGLGEGKNEPFLQNHNPKTFEDMSAPIPNFRAMALKAGEVPKFFDSVLQGRASDALAKKDAWWAARKTEAESTKSGKTFAAFPKVPVPEWTHGKSVSMESLKSVTDVAIKSLEPVRKLKLSPSGETIVEEGGKQVEVKFMTKAAAAKAVAVRRAQVHDRYLKFWAKKLLVAPEAAVVPMKEVDSQLASKFEGVSPAYSELLSAVSGGPKTLGERITESPAFSSFLLKRSASEAKADYPGGEAEAEGVALAAKLEDPRAALEHLLGPEMQVLGGSGLLSEQVKAITEHKYSPDRYMYKEGMKLAAKLAAEEAELAAIYGADAVAALQAQPQSPAEQLSGHTAAKASKFAAAEKAAASPYTEYAMSRLQAFASDPSNVAFDEVLHPALVEELLEVELAALAEAEASIDDSEEEELWALTMSAQLKHLQRHFGVDLPHGVLAHMDPILIKKIDWETTYGLDDWDAVLEDMGSEYAKEQWGMESLSHHFLPLIRYRRAKARAASGKWDAEASGAIRH